MENNNEWFEYTYSAKQQEEIEQIRRKYIPKEEDKLTELKRLDESVTRPGTIAGIVLGLLGTLLLGVGMSLVLVWADSMMIQGIVVGVVGFIIMGTAYPVYVKITAKQKEKIAPQILELTEELMGSKG